MHETAARGIAAELIAAYRFTEAKRTVAWPMGTAPYDLIVEHEGCCYRVQVRQAQLEDRPEKGRVWVVNLRKTRGTRRKDVPTPAATFEYIAAVCTPDHIYVIPTGACTAAHDPTRLLTRLRIYTGPQAKRFAAFLNQFCLGAPYTTEAVAGITPKRRSIWSKTAVRKSYVRLPTEVVATIQALPIQWDTRTPLQPGYSRPSDVAGQFGISVATLKNLCRGKRKDLQPAS